MTSDPVGGRGEFVLPVSADDETSERRLVAAASAADSAPDPIVAIDDSGVVTYANQAAHRLLERDQMEGLAVESLLEMPSGYTVAHLLTPGPQRLMAHARCKLSGELEVEVSTNATTDGNGRFVLLLHPFPRQEHTMRELLRRATHDELTSLSNRSFLLERLDATFRDPRTAAIPHALVMMDLDGFKRINDSWGHDAGDAVLVAVADRLRGLCRPGDVVARLGGDEFAAWCSRVDDTQVATLTGRLSTAFADPIRFGELELRVTGSVGATTTSFAHHPNELLRQADSAMYRAKAAGPGRQVIFDAHMSAELRERGRRERELRDALPANQFILHYQPVFALGSREVIGVEALARWQHPRLGQLQPADFLPLIESTLLGSEFDMAIIDRACHQLADWADNPSTPPTMWINVSPRSLGPGLVDKLTQVTEELNIDATNLVIELTDEATTATDEEVSVLEAMHNLGARIAVDDFGTGSSHLSYLPDLPVDLVKLDRSFVHGISLEPERHAVASSVIGLAHALHAEVVAEGVERRADLDVLASLGCDHAQGFLLARPAPPGDLPDIDLRDIIDLR